MPAENEELDIIKNRKWRPFINVLRGAPCLNDEAVLNEFDRCLIPSLRQITDKPAQSGCSEWKAGSTKWLIRSLRILQNSGLRGRAREICTAATSLSGNR